MKTAWTSDRGKARENNEDSILVDGEKAIFLLADGLGGHRGGETASSLAVSTVYEYLADRPGRIGSSETFRLLADSLAGAHSAVYRKSLSDENLHDMGTTLEIVVIANYIAYICHVGDSRVYLLRNDRLKKITTDDNAAAWLLEHEHIPERFIPAEARHILTQAVGVSRELVPEFYSLHLQPRDIILMCTDGLTGMLDDGKIGDIVRKYRDNLDKAADELVNEANARGGQDNISVILIDPRVPPALLAHDAATPRQP